MCLYADACELNRVYCFFSCNYCIFNVKFYVRMSVKSYTTVCVRGKRSEKENLR